MRWLSMFALCGLLHAAEIGLAGYAPVIPGQPLRFPADEGSHPEFRTEWWYLTGWLTVADEAKSDKAAAGENGQPLGFQITFFRSRPNAVNDNPSAFAPRQLLFAHAAISDAEVGRLQHDERAARAGFGLAEADEGRTEVWIDDWSLRQNEQGYRAEIPASGFQLSLQFEKTQPPLIQGDRGYSRKGPDAAHASYYYSMPQLKVSGTITHNGKTETVNGTAWLDHEWSSTYLAEGAVGWDWTAINLDDGGAFMAFRIRDANGASVWAGGSYRSPPSAHAEAGLGGMDSNSRRFAPHSPPSRRADTLPAKPAVCGERALAEPGSRRAKLWGGDGFQASLPHLAASQLPCRDAPPAPDGCANAVSAGPSPVKGEGETSIAGKNPCGLDTESLRVAPSPLAGEGRGGEAGQGRGAETRIFRRDEISFTPLRAWRSPRTSTEYPVVMRVRAGDLDFTLKPLFDDQEFDARASTGTIYWEGAVRATQNGKSVGRGYLELTGYWRKLTM